MRIEPAGFRHQAFREHIELTYRLGLNSLKFHPVGEDSYGYIASGPLTACFIKLHQGPPAASITESLEGAYALRHGCDLEFVIAPIKNISGCVRTDFQTFTYEVYPFVSGSYAFIPEEPMPSPAAVGQMIGRLHSAGNENGHVKLRKENFSAAFSMPLLQVLDAAGAEHPAGVRSETADLLTRSKGRILNYLEDHVNAGKRLKAQNTAWAFTHGDSHWANILQDDQGQLFMIDWDDLYTAPPERDLMFFNGPDLLPVLEGYAQMAKTPLHLSAERFGFYFDRWALAEIADFGTRILMEDLPEVEIEFAWEELQQYVPLRRDTIAEQVFQLEGILHSYERP